MNGPRHRAREAALRALYLWEVGRTEPAVAVETFFAEHAPDAPEAVRQFAGEIVLGTTAETAALDAIIAQHTEHWRVERLAVIDRLILRMAVWELRHAPDTPAPVVLNEALELARRFSADDSVRFVNGVLDGIRKSL
jgi:transcription antitermination protein NusB